MKFPHCPLLDRFRSELLEAYRRNEKRENLTTDSWLIPSEEVTSIHHAITQHRVTCPICREIAHHLTIVGSIGGAGNDEHVP
jgi:hypothetical protein